jgi:hypothetical protein
MSDHPIEQSSSVASPAEHTEQSAAEHKDSAYADAVRRSSVSAPSIWPRCGSNCRKR